MSTTVAVAHRTTQATVSTASLYGLRRNTYVVAAKESRSEPSGTGEVCDNGQDDDADTFTDCEDQDCLMHQSCTGEICGDNLDNDRNGFTDCDDFACENDRSCAGEICDNGLNDDDNGFSDCEDISCEAHQSCIDEICDNSRDDDGSGFTDCEDFASAPTPATPRCSRIFRAITGSSRSPPSR